MRKYCCFLFGIMGISGFSQSDDPTHTTELREVTISAFRPSDSLMNTAISIARINPSDLNRTGGYELASSLNRLPGISMQSGAWNTNRVSIRGIGSRTPYGTNKVRAFYGFIPLTSGDSETTIEDLDPENIGGISIVKGPLSSAFGSGLGGAILIEPKRSPAQGTQLSAGATHGGFGLMKNRLSAAIGSEHHAHRISAHSLSSDGFRNNSDYDRLGLTASGHAGNFSYFVNYTNLNAFLPSSISRADFEQRPHVAAPTWQAARGYEDYTSLFGGISHEAKIFKNAVLQTAVYANRHDSEEARPFDYLQQLTNGLGFRAQVSGNFGIFRWIGGVEMFFDTLESATFENLYEQNNGNGSLIGERVTYNEQRRQQQNYYVELSARMSRHWTLQGGVNLNQSGFRLNESDMETQRNNYTPVVAPQIGVLYRPDALQSYFAKVSRGFSLPAISETLDEQGRVNTDLKPEVGENFEIGAKRFSKNRRWHIEAAAYWMNVRNLLVAQRVDDDRYVGTNAGRSLHRGAEISIGHESRIANWVVNGKLSAQAGKFTFERFDNNGQDFSGNALPGVAPYTIYTGITLSNLNGFYILADARFSDQMPLDDSNSGYTRSYAVLDLKAGHRFGVGKQSRLHIFAGVNNVADTRYAAMILPNAPGSTPEARRSFYPGAPQHFYGGLSISGWFD